MQRRLSLAVRLTIACAALALYIPASPSIAQEPAAPTLVRDVNPGAR